MYSAVQHNQILIKRLLLLHSYIILSRSLTMYLEVRVMVGKQCIIKPPLSFCQIGHLLECLVEMFTSRTGEV